MEWFRVIVPTFGNSILIHNANYEISYSCDFQDLDIYTNAIVNHMSDLGNTIFFVYGEVLVSIDKIYLNTKQVVTERDNLEEFKKVEKQF